MDQEPPKARTKVTYGNVMLVVGVVALIAAIAVAAAITHDAGKRTVTDVEASDRQLRAPVPAHINRGTSTPNQDTPEPQAAPETEKGRN